MVNQQFFSPWEGVKVSNSEMVSPIISHNYTCWWILNIFFSVNLLSLKFCTHVINIEMVQCQKFHGQVFFAILRRVPKLAIVKFFFELHLLVDFKYIFLSKSFSLEIWHMCCYYKDDVVPKPS